jgi:antitoxin component YwqK of YwqJK toxin-antitoxin module
MKNVMKRLLLIVLPLLLIVGCSKPVDNESLKDRNGVKYKPDSQKPYTGEVFELYDNGNKKRDGYYKDGLMDGVWTNYYDNGNKRFTDYYKENNYVDTEFFDEDGSLKNPITYKKELFFGNNNKLHGKYVVYDENGIIIRSWSFKDNKEEGLWYNKGDYTSYPYVDYRGTYKNGKMVGKWKITRNNDGQPSSNDESWELYHNNKGSNIKVSDRSDLIKLTGSSYHLQNFIESDSVLIDQLVYYDHGVKKYVNQYENGQLISRKKWDYYLNKQKKEEKTYNSEGWENGLWIQWYENGQKKEQLTYKNGYWDGLHSNWYENGQKRYEGVYNQGIENGLETWWYENGQKKEQLTYKNGNWDGLYTSWYKTGQKKSEENWKDGKLISSKEWNEDGSVKE